VESILRRLYNGSVIPWERRNPKNEEQLEIVRQIEREERYFMEKLSPDDCKRFQELSNLYLSISKEDEENTFIYGFTLGALLMQEIMEESKVLPKE